MHKRYLRSALWVGCVVTCSAWAAHSAVAQAPSTPTPAPQAAPPPATVTPTVPETPPAPTVEPAIPAPPPRVTPPPPPPPPPPQYGRLGGHPESAVQEGDWNPWDHPESGGRYVHEGFFLRLQIGPGGSVVSRDNEEYSGIGLGMGLAIGGSVVENLALHVDLQTTWLLSPNAEIGGRDDRNFDANIGLQSLGVGVTYYFMPVDLFLSGSLGIGRLAFETDDGDTKETSAGLTLNALLGKEWWVGSDWGIGVAGQFLFMHVKDYTDDAGMNGLAINVLFTATYN